MKQNKTEQSWMQGPRAFSVIEALVGAAIIGMGLAAISGAINYSTSQHSKLKGATDSILAHTEVLKAVQAQNMQASQIISLCKKIKVRNSDGGGDLLDLSGQSVDDLKTPNFIKALDIGTGDCGNGSSCLYEVGQRVPPNFDVTVRQIVVEGNKDTSGEFVPDKSDLKIDVCEYPNNISDCKMGVGQEKIFEVYQLDLAVITSREKSDTSTGIGQNAQGEVEFKTAEEARIYTPLKIPMTIYTHSDKIVACSLSKVLHACERTVSGDLGAAGGALLVKGSLADPQELTCDLRAAALQGLPKQLGSSSGSHSDHFCISGPLYSVQKPRRGVYGCTRKIGNIAYNALVCEKGCGDTELVGEGFKPRQMLQWNDSGTGTGLKIFHCVKCLGPDGSVVKPCDTGLECNLEAKNEARQEWRSCLEQATSTLDNRECGFPESTNDINTLRECCDTDADCRREAYDCARRAGPAVVAEAGISWWRKSCPEFVKDEEGEFVTNDHGHRIPTPERDDAGMCPITPVELAYACMGQNSEGESITDPEMAQSDGSDPTARGSEAARTDSTPVEPADAEARRNVDSLPCDLLKTCQITSGGDSTKVRSVNYNYPVVDRTDTSNPAGHYYHFQCDYPDGDTGGCAARGKKYRVPTVLLAERIPKSVLGDRFSLHTWNSSIEGQQIEGYYYSQAQNWPRPVAGLVFKGWQSYTKKNKYYYTVASSSSSESDSSNTVRYKTSPVPFPHDDVDAGTRPHDYNSGETALEAVGRRKNSYAYACWADREQAQNSDAMKWRLDSWDERRQRLRDEGPAHQGPNSSGNYDNTSNIRQVRPIRAGDYNFSSALPSAQQYGSARYRGNFLYHDGLSLLKSIAMLHDFPDEIRNNFPGQDQQPYQVLQVDIPGLPNKPTQQNNIRRAWLACATDDLGFWKDVDNDDGVQKPTGLESRDACSDYVSFKVDPICNSWCSPPDQSACCGGHTCRPNNYGAVSSSIFAGIKHPDNPHPHPHPRQHPSNSACKSSTRSLQFHNPWIAESVSSPDDTYPKWKAEFIKKLAKYMKWQRPRNNGYWGLAKDAEDKDGITAESLLKNSSGGFKSNIEIAKNFWKWFSLVHCDTYKYNQPVYRHRFACFKDSVVESKLITIEPKTNGALECCVKWAQKYNFGDRVDVDANGQIIATGNDGKPAQPPDLPTPQNDNMHSETYFVGPSDPEQCMKEDLSSPASQ